ncbi:MAG: GvpL/GvpF family gas vesicle protein [Chloroflexi bacterium]|nr:GvpL/GvpF family gas vesicle protein [Chloroflexota bacterium]
MTTDRRSKASPQTGAAAGTDPADTWGWYLYGITRHRAAGLPGAVGSPGLDGGQPVDLHPVGDLVAIVSRVPLAEFGAEAIRARGRDAPWLEVMALGHARVVESIHREQPVLPARFGCVYPSAADLAAALREGHTLLAARLAWMEGCDEWAVRLFADRVAIEERVAASAPAVRQLRHDLAGASPGRAFFLQRQLAGLLAVATDRDLSDLAQAGYDDLLRYAVAGRVRPRQSQPAPREALVLHAAFLVRRGEADAFLAALQRAPAGETGLRWSSSGPWPPYSFAAPEEALP